MTGGSANRRRRQSEGAHHAGESRWPRKQQMNPAGTTRIRFRKVSAFPDSFLTPHRSPQNEGRTEVSPILVIAWLYPVVKRARGRSLRFGFTAGPDILPSL